jgi:phosphotransferase system HPr (HPr) family protein
MSEQEAAAELSVEHDHGLHLRPAADFVRLAARYRADVRVANLSRSGGRQANGRSLLEVTALGVDRGHTIRITARGEDAQEAVDALEGLIRSNFGA